jgi:hypothetical protein
MTNHTLIKVAIFVLGVAAFCANASAQMQPPWPNHYKPQKLWPETPKRNPVWPPVEFDYPYKGKLVVRRLETPADIRAACPNANFANRIPVACTRLTGEVCVIVMLPGKALMAFDLDPDDVYRHENGHCNGWIH